MADTPKGGRKRKQQKQTLSPAGATPLVDKEGNDSIIISDSPPESQDIKRRQKKLENDIEKEAAGNDPAGGQTETNMAADQNKTPGEGVGNDQAANNIPTTSTMPQIPSLGVNETSDAPQAVRGRQETKKVMDDITKKSVEEILGTEPSKPKRGRPRRRGLSVDPGTKPSQDDLMNVLLGIRQDNAVLKQDLVQTLDVKMSEFKQELSRDLVGINEKVNQQSTSIEGIRVAINADRGELKDLDLKVQGMEDELDTIRTTSQKTVNSIVEQVTNVETSLAQDIETVKVHIEEKFEEHKQHQMLTEDRLNDITVNLEKENAVFRVELEDLRATIEKLQNPSASNMSSLSLSGAVADSRPNSQNSDSDRTSNWSGSGGSLSLYYTDSNLSQQEHAEVNEAPESMGRLNRSIILSNVREREGENLKLFVLDCVTEIGVSLKPEDIETVYRIGDESEKRAWPRPVKCVLYDVIQRDQILHFKSRLRYSHAFKEVKVNREEHKELRVKSAMLRHAALIARREGRYVFQKEDRVIIDGTAYTLETTDDIPHRYQRNPNNDIDLSLAEKARTRAQHVVMVGHSLQKLNYGLGFFSSNCFLSNFFECEVVCRNVSYRTLEHGYQARKAEICRDERAYHEIRRARFPAEAKRVGGRIKTTVEWDRQKLDVMVELLFCKFRQNRTLYFQLLNTRPHDLFECTTCEFWGTGCKLRSIMLEERSWTGANHLGRMLMHVRSVLVKEMGKDHDPEVKS